MCLISSCQVNPPSVSLIRLQKKLECFQFRLELRLSKKSVMSFSRWEARPLSLVHASPYSSTSTSLQDATHTFFGALTHLCFFIFTCLPPLDPSARQARISLGTSCLMFRGYNALFPKVPKLHFLTYGQLRTSLLNVKIRYEISCFKSSQV